MKVALSAAGNASDSACFFFLEVKSLLLKRRRARLNFSTFPYLVSNRWSWNWNLLILLNLLLFIVVMGFREIKKEQRLLTSAWCRCPAIYTPYDVQMARPRRVCLLCSRCRGQYRDCPYTSGFRCDGYYTYEHPNFLTLAWLLNGLELAICLFPSALLLCWTDVVALGVGSYLLLLLRIRATVPVLAEFSLALFT